MAVALASDSNCIDIGAGTGELTADMVKYAPGGRHIAYEALAELSQVISRTLPSVDVRCAAVSDTSGHTEFLLVPEAPGWSGLRDYEDVKGASRRHTVTVPVVKLDGDLPPDYVPTLIKIDVNGAELQVIRGARETIGRHRPMVIFEHGQAAAAYGTTHETIFDLLVGDLKLRLYDLEGHGPFTREQFLESASSRWNFIARS
jgi:FkbM family methyltransferase